MSAWVIGAHVEVSGEVSALESASVKLPAGIRAFSPSSRGLPWMAAWEEAADAIVQGFFGGEALLVAVREEDERTHHLVLAASHATHDATALIAAALEAVEVLTEGKGKAATQAAPQAATKPGSAGLDLFLEEAPATAIACARLAFRSGLAAIAQLPSLMLMMQQKPQQQQQRLSFAEIDEALLKAACRLQRTTLTAAMMAAVDALIPGDRRAPIALTFDLRRGTSEPARGMRSTAVPFPRILGSAGFWEAARRQAQAVATCVERGEARRSAPAFRLAVAMLPASVVSSGVSATVSNCGSTDPLRRGASPVFFGSDGKLATVTDLHALIRNDHAGATPFVVFFAFQGRIKITASSCDFDAGALGALLLNQISEAGRG